MLRIRAVEHLAGALSTSIEQLQRVLAKPDLYYEELVLIDPAKPGKRRTVVDVRGDMRIFQSRLYRRLLLPKCTPSAYSHGGVPHRSIKTNVGPHLQSGFVFKADISNFYPSIHFRRVYKLFAEQFECSPDVARLCTRLCTYRYHLALGLITSPILANQVLRRVDRRIAGACHKVGLIYTRYVDDIAISGPFDLATSKVPELIEGILAKDGFQTNPSKHNFGRLDGHTSITSVRPKDGHYDVTTEYAVELDRQIADAANLARGDEFHGPYFTRSQILGRVRFACWVNPRRRRRLIRKFRAIDWHKVKAEAQNRGLIQSKKVLRKKEETKGALPPRLPPI